MAKPATKATALWVVRRLTSAGYRALLAGGCVRDMLLGRRCYDYDVATDATPQQVKKLFSHVLLIGAKFGVAMVIHRGRKVEVATFRSDLSYSDGRRPDGVRYSSPKQDALRRDFTINGMFYDPLADELIDYVSGREDLASGVIRTIGSPRRRFGEDYLRMLRAVRFSAVLNFSIARPTTVAIRKHSAGITDISGERIFDELTKMLAVSSAPQALKAMHELGLAQRILPELFAGDKGEKDGKKLWPAALERVSAIAKRCDTTLALMCLLAEIKPANIRKILRRWGAPNDLRDEICFAASHLDDWQKADSMPLCDFKRLLGSGYFGRLVRLWSLREKMTTGKKTLARKISARIRTIRPEAILPPPLITGNDLTDMGLPQGPRIGKILKSIYNEQLNEKITTRPEALKQARREMKK